LQPAVLARHQAADESTDWSRLPLLDLGRSEPFRWPRWLDWFDALVAAAPRVGDGGGPQRVRSVG